MLKRLQRRTPTSSRVRLLTPGETSLVRIAFSITDASVRERLIASVQSDPLARLIRKIWREIDERNCQPLGRRKPFTFVIPRVNEILLQRLD